MQVAADSDDFDNMDRFLALLEGAPQGFVARLLGALDDADTSLTFAITTPAEAEGASVTRDAIAVTVDNVDPAADADVVEEPGRKAQAVRTDALNEVVTAGGVKVALPGNLTGGEQDLERFPFNLPWVT